MMAFSAMEQTRAAAEAAAYTRATHAQDQTVMAIAQRCAMKPVMTAQQTTLTVHPVTTAHSATEQILA
jgi:hypothetical protein